MVLAVGVVAIALVGPGERTALQIPDRIGFLERTPSEEVSRPDEMIATYIYGPHVAVFAVSRKNDTKGHTEECVRLATGSQCTWSDRAFVYTLVDDSLDVAATQLFATQAERAFKVANGL